MTVRRVYVTTDARARRRQVWADVWMSVRVLARMAGCLLAAPLELVAARLGLPPAAWTWRQIAADWRRRTGRAPSETTQETPVLSGVVFNPNNSDSGEESRG
ncbi:hypothetical protein [Actinomadura sp. 21ATH]|uniref:hypothetical protein n=1 Tax=Actinomadura sp. 21ATH TaxID=1735444 RepID=UPI0035C0B10B